MDAVKLIDELVRDEGLKLKPYKDSEGILTIGIGRNLEAVGISKATAYQMAHEDIERAGALLDQHLPWWRSLNEARQRVLMNMTFNMGIVRLLGFTATLALIEAGDYEKAGHEMLNSHWATQVGARAVRLSQGMIAGLL